MIKEHLPEAVFRYIKADDSIQSYVNEHLGIFSHFIACGGDGTVNQVANSLAGHNYVTMGVIPLGSGNDFAQNIGLTGNFEYDFSILLNNKTQNIDAIQGGKEIFVNTYGIGVDGLTNYYASISKFKTGFLKYFSGGLRALFKGELFDAEVWIDDDQQLSLRSIWMIAIANGKTEGGRYKISPHSDSSDGLAEIIVVKGIPRVSLILEFVKLSMGISFKKSVIETYNFNNKLRVKSSAQVRSHSDGEQMGKHKDYYFKMRKQALRVVVK